MDKTYLTPQEAADILKIKKTTVYDMIKKGNLKAVKLGKQLRIQEADVHALIGDVFRPVNAVSQYSDTDISVDSFINEAVPISGIVVCGQDMLLDILCSYVNEAAGNAAVMRSYLGSYNGLYALYQGQVNIATAHLWDVKTDVYNLPFIEKLLPGEDVRVYNVVKRPVGIYVAAGNPKNITGIQDFARADIVMLNREKGSGIRVLTDSLFQKHRIDTGSLNGYSRAVNSHMAAASVIARGGADCAVGNQRTVLHNSALDFVPVKEESYDMIIPVRETANPVVQKVINVLGSEQFRAEIEVMGGYDVTNMGRRIL